MKSILPKCIDNKQLEKAFDVFLEDISTKKSNEWDKIIGKQKVQLFKETYRTVPAYKKFIDAAKVDPTSITTSVSFGVVPSVSKKNYLRKNEWGSLCKTGEFSKKPLVMTSTSGSTGEPFYFPRYSDVDTQSSVCHQMFLRSSNISKNKSTLIIDCFGMGVWIGGLITYQAFKQISERGYPLTIITPGINKREIFQALRNIGKNFDTVILCGYPPLIKDLIDDAGDNGIVWSDYSLKIIFAAESFSETFRDYIVKHAGIKDAYRDTMNIYGSADLGTMAQESPLCILLRRIALRHPNVYRRLFGQAERLPTLAQFIPWFVTFESNKNSIYCTADNAIPLIKYEIGDNGGVLRYRDVEVLCEEEGIDLKHEIKQAGIGDTITELPFVYVYERSDFSASYYGALIYPEFIKKALDDESVSDFVTGKFSMSTKNDEKENQFLEINIELKHHQKVNAKIRSHVLKLVHTTLMHQSAEYKKIAESLGEKSYPKLVFWNYGDETHFFGGAKQKWVK